MCRCGGGDEHDHLDGTNQNDLTTLKSLHQYVDFSKSTALNVKKEGSLATVLRAQYDQVTIIPLQSDVDPQIIIKIQFSCTVKVYGISVVAQDENTNPLRMKAYVNMTDLDFTNIEGKSVTQEWILADSMAGTDLIKYPTKQFKFQNVNHLTLYFPEARGSSRGLTSITFLGVYGQFSQNRIGVVEAIYEAKPMPSDHKSESFRMNPSQTGF